MTPTDLKTAREALGLSQRALAERLGVSKDTLNRWERGRQGIHFPTILALALHALASVLPARPAPASDEESPDPEF